MKHASIITAVLLLVTASAFAQRGGKAEPKRITFAAGVIGTTVRGSLHSGEEMEYVFAARKGQTISVLNPATSMFDVRVFSDEAGVETEFDSSREFSLNLPADGDYMLFVRKKSTRSSARARFAVTIRIR